MVMLFVVDNVRNFLLSKGYVYTFRTKKHREGKDWITDKRNGKKICNVEITFVRDINGSVGLMPYVSESGFSNHWDWVMAIQKFYPKMKNIQGYLYRVKVLR